MTPPINSSFNTKMAALVGTLWRHKLLWFIAAAFSLSCFASVLSYPPVWPDEAVPADIVNNLRTHNTLASTLMQGIAPHVESRVYYYPPAYFYFLAAFEHLFDNSLGTLRSSSTLLGVLCLIVFYVCVHQISKRLTWVALASAALGVDFLFFRMAHIARPEALVMLFSLIAFLSVQHLLSSKNRIWFVVCGTAASLAFQSHFLGLYVLLALVATLILVGPIKFRFRSLIMLVSIFALTSLPTIIPLVLNHTDALAQIVSAAQSRNFFQTQVVSGVQLLDSYLLISLLLLVVLITLVRNIPLTVFFVFSWIFLLKGNMIWYTAHIIPYFYLSLFATLAWFKSNNRLGDQLSKLGTIITTCVVVLVVGINVSLTTQAITTNQNESANYTRLARWVVQHIPPNASVYLSSIPDMFFAFDPGRNTLYQFPSFPAPKEHFQTLLVHIDYLVLSYYPESIFYKDTLKDYLAVNTDSEIIDPESGVTIIKLVDTTARIVPTS